MLLKKYVIWPILMGGLLASIGFAYRNNSPRELKRWVMEWYTGNTSTHEQVRFMMDLIDQLNHARQQADPAAPKILADQELTEWLQKKLASPEMQDVEVLKQEIRKEKPHYMEFSVGTSSSASLNTVMEQLQEMGAHATGQMTHVSCALQRSLGGLKNEALFVIGHRLKTFSPECLNDQKREVAYFSVCPLCNHPHTIRVKQEQSTLGLECPKCLRHYAVVASDSEGKFRYINEYLTGYAPPAVFAENSSRIHELFTICSAVRGSCVYTRDPGARLNEIDAWQTSLETQKLGHGDCEDSAIYLCDWLLSRGYQARVVLGRYGDLGGHAWVVVRMNEIEYLIESTEAALDPLDPPIISKVGSRYLPETLFDRHAIYVRANPRETWANRGGDYWSDQIWLRIEPREADPKNDPAVVDALKLNTAAKASSTAEPTAELSKVKLNQPIWKKPLPAAPKVPVKH